MAPTVCKTKAGLGFTLDQFKVGNVTGVFVLTALSISKAVYDVAVSRCRRSTLGRTTETHASAVPAIKTNRSPPESVQFRGRECEEYFSR